MYQKDFVEEAFQSENIEMLCPVRKSMFDVDRE